jgi:hypothetical protein
MFSHALIFYFKNKPCTVRIYDDVPALRPVQGINAFQPKIFFWDGIKNSLRFCFVFVQIAKQTDFW